MRYRQETDVKKYTPPPVQLDQGKPDMRQAALAAAYVLGALVVAAVGGWIATQAMQPYRQAPGLAVVGCAVTVVALMFGHAMLRVTLGEWSDYRERMLDWHDVAVEAYKAVNGTETTTQRTELDYSPDSLAHVILTALYVHLRNQAEDGNAHTVRALRGPMFLAQKRIGTLSHHDAEEMARKLAALGLIEGRDAGQAGTWVPQSADEVLERVLEKW